MPDDVTRIVSAKVRDAAPGALLQGTDVDDADWYDVPVPGDLHLALAAAGAISHPHDEPGDEAYLWMEDREWWYRLRLPSVDAAPGDRVRLVLHGIDTYATLWLNGDELGRHSSMFVPFVADVTDRLHGDDLLAVCVHRPLDLERPDRSEVRRMRKAQLSYGWDFAPRRPGIGLWQPAELVRDRGTSIEALRFATEALGATATCRVDVEVTGPAEGVAVALTAPDGSVTEAAGAVVDGRAQLVLTVTDPQLWWSHDLGEQPLYALSAAVARAGEVLATSTKRVGIRTVELDQASDPDRPGSAFFRFRLNGELLCARGANWVPADTALGAVDPRRVTRLLELAREGSMNMVRVWGGGIYEPDAFYDTCDELGLLVWQDLMFAGWPYDDSDPQWFADVEAEVRHQVGRIGSHACLALWCGNNEVEMLAELLEWDDPVPARRVFHELAPAAVEGSGVPYLPTSPHHGYGPDRGDRHNWEVWHGLRHGDPGRTALGWLEGSPVLALDSPEAAQFAQEAGAHRYLDDEGRFCSEYGLASAPSLETLARWSGGRVPDLEQLQARLRPGRLGPRNKLEMLLAPTLGLPGTVEEYVAFSQLLQAEGVRTGAEHYRRRWPSCGGSLVWQLNDCWPSLSWAMVDVDERPKAVWHYARRFFAPVLASFAPTGTGAELWISNNGREAVKEDLVVQHLAFTGEVQERVVVPVDVPAGVSAAVASFDAPGDPTAGCLRVTASFGRNRHLWAPVKDLVRGAGAPAWDARVDGDLLRVTVTGTAYHLAVHAAPEDARVIFDDNHVDLAPGETRVLTARHHGVTGVTVRSL